MQPDLEWNCRVLFLLQQVIGQQNATSQRHLCECSVPCSGGISPLWSVTWYAVEWSLCPCSDSCLVLIGESIPIRLFLAGYELTPTMRDINKKFSVRYYLNLVLIDEEERRYFKQQVRAWAPPTNPWRP